VPAKYECKRNGCRRGLRRRREDDSNQTGVNGTNVHVCPNGALLIGVDAKNNRFLCSNALMENPAPTLVADLQTHVNFSYGGREHSIHVCPPNSAMVGWNRAKKAL
jgi:hypothetical protein